MRRKIILCILLAVWPLFACDGSSSMSPEESSLVEESMNKFLSGDIPFSFRYGDESSESVISSVKVKISKKKKRKEHIIEIVKKWKLKDGLTITLQTRRYTDYPAVEWIVYFTNNGESESQVISDLYALDHRFHSSSFDSLEVHTNKGDDCSAFSYEPYSILFKEGKAEVFQPTRGGKSSTGDRGWPYWNVQNGSSGLILALGWPGAWRCLMKKESNTFFAIKAGQATFSSYLKPGETVRTPLVCMVFWKDLDRFASQNLWRAFYLAHIIPKFSGKAEQPATEIQISQTEASINQAQMFIDAGIKPRICWKDAGWYPTMTGNWLETGDWVMKPDVYPNGIKKFTEWAHKEGMESLLWFEPERVHNGDNYLYNYHKEWLVQSCDRGFSTLNIGNGDCLRWLINHVDSVIVANGIDWYREDMNGSGPQCLWEKLDTDGRKGIHENLYVQGHLKFWDELKKRHPKLHIDACASGGRRNDLETMHRAVPLLRSDYQWASLGEEYIRGNQGHTWALSAWLPYQGSALYEYEPYKYRSFYLPCFGMGSLTEVNIRDYQKAVNECKQIQPMMLYGDFWPLTPYTIEKDQWIGWQFDYKKAGKGFVQLFRREDCVEDNLCIKLRNLIPDAIYEIKNLDTSETKSITGNSLMNGIFVSVQEAPGSAILIYYIK